MKAKVVLALLFLVLSFPAAPEIEKHAIMTDKGIKLFWWPKLSTPAGWRHDEELSLKMSSNVLLPKGRTYEDAPSLIYGRAFYDPKTKKKAPGSLQSYIDDDLANFHKARENLLVKEVRPGLSTAQGRTFRTFDFTYDPSTWDETCYAREGDYWLIMTLSSQTQTAFLKDRATFRKVISEYR